MGLNGNSAYGDGNSHSVTGADKPGLPPVGIGICKPVIVWHARPGR